MSRGICVYASVTWSELLYALGEYAEYGDASTFASVDPEILRKITRTLESRMEEYKRKEHKEEV